LPTFCETFLPKIIKIQLCMLELQLKMSGILFYETQFIEQDREAHRNRETDRRTDRRTLDRFMTLICRIQRNN